MAGGADVVRWLAGAVVGLLVALLAAQAATAGDGLLVGVDDDQITWANRPTRVLGATEALGLGAMRVTLRWRPGRRNLEARDHTVLRRAVAVRPSASASSSPSTDGRSTVRNALVRYREIRDVVIWNEVNSPAFWRPQATAPEDYEALLARCWDLLHSSFPDVDVVTSTAGAHDPISFVHGLAAAYVRRARTRPLFDTFGHNPYPVYPFEPPAAQHEVYVGEGDYARLVGALDGDFAGTPEGPAPIWYLEDGFQTRVASPRRHLYAGQESEPWTLSPDEQALQLAAALRLAYCQPRVPAFFNFLLVDEPGLPGWQSGLLWADWTRKPAFAAYRAAIDDVRRGEVECAVRLA